MFFLGLKIGSISPECKPEEILAPKILTKLPLSPENNGSRVNKVGLVNKVVSDVLNTPPAKAPNKEQTNKTGVDCFKMVLLSLEYFNP